MHDLGIEEEQWNKCILKIHIKWKIIKKIRIMIIMDMRVDKERNSLEQTEDGTWKQYLSLCTGGFTKITWWNKCITASTNIRRKPELISMHAKKHATTMKKIHATRTKKIYLQWGPQAYHSTMLSSCDMLVQQKSTENENKENMANALRLGDKWK